MFQAGAPNRFRSYPDQLCESFELWAGFSAGACGASLRGTETHLSGSVTANFLGLSFLSHLAFPSLTFT